MKSATTPPTTQAGDWAKPAAAPPASGRETIQLGEHEVYLPDPERARTPAQLRRCYTEEDLAAFATCLHGYKLDGRPAPPPLEDVLLFAWRAKQTGLDPFSGHLVGIYRNDREEGRCKLAIQTEVAGYRTAAYRSGELLEISEPEFDREPDDKPPVWAKVTVTRAGAYGRELKIAFTARFSEFVRQTPIWKSMPWHMLGVRATGHALRNAFPDILAGLDTPGGDDDDHQDERPRAAAPRTDVVPVAPAPRKPLPDPAPAKAGAP